VSYADKNTGGIVYASISGERLATCIMMGIEVLDVLVEPNTPSVRSKKGKLHIWSLQISSFSAKFQLTAPTAIFPTVQIETFNHAE
jgi:hypothetical protein